MVDIELNENIMSENARELEDLKSSIQHKMLNNLYINVDVRLVAPKSIKRSEGKAVRVIDKRRSNGV